MCFAVFSSVFRIQTTKKSQHTLATNRQAAGFKLYYSFSPPRNGLRPPVWLHVILEAFSMVGGDLLQAHKYHIAKGVKTVSTLSQDPKITYHLTSTKKFKFILGTSVEKCDYSIL